MGAILNTVRVAVNGKGAGLPPRRVAGKFYLWATNLEYLVLAAIRAEPDMRVRLTLEHELTEARRRVAYWAAILDNPEAERVFIAAARNLLAEVRVAAASAGYTPETVPVAALKAAYTELGAIGSLC